MQKSAPRPHDPLIGRDKSKVANDEIVEFRKADDPMEVVEKANVDSASRHSCRQSAARHSCQQSADQAEQTMYVQSTCDQWDLSGPRIS